MSVARPASSTLERRPARTGAKNSAPVPSNTRTTSPAPASSGKSGCACGGGCPRCRGGAFTDVRIHTDAADVTRQHRARAVTRGQEIYFAPGQFRPGTPDGDRLIAHEMAHTLQTRRGATSAFVSPAALEQNAHDLASGRSVAPLTAPRSAVLPDRLPGEEWWQEPRRLAVLEHYRALLPQLRLALETGTLLPNERTRTRDRVQEMFSGDIYSRDQRAAILLRLHDVLVSLTQQLELFPIPASWDAPTSEEYHMSSADMDDETITDAVMFHLHWSADRHRPLRDVAQENTYIFSLLSLVTPDPAEPSTHATPEPEPEARTGEMRPHDMPTSSGTGYWIVVPHPADVPQDFYHYSHLSYVPRGALIVEVAVDVVGHFYIYEGRRVYIPRPGR
jgi:Domain of unknown function (DUF4157)